MTYAWLTPGTGTSNSTSKCVTPKEQNNENIESQ